MAKTLSVLFALVCATSIAELTNSLPWHMPEAVGVASTTMLVSFMFTICMTVRLPFRGEALVNVELNVGRGEGKWSELVGSAK